MSREERVVFDCNVYLQAMISPHGPALACWRLAESGRLSLYVSATVLAEIRSLPLHPALRRLRSLTQERVDRFIVETLAHANLVEVIPSIFKYDRDPVDAHYVNLALAAEARLIVSRDKDLLALNDATRIEGREFLNRFPQLRILQPQQLLQEFQRI